MSAKIALCASLELPQGALPERLTVVPAGETLAGRDGRKWTVKDRQAILAQLTSAGPVLLDENHASALAAPSGGKSPACGWLSDFKWSEAGLNAAVEWTPYGQELFSKKAYRYLSPALLHDTCSERDTLGNVLGLHSVGLTNHPNLDLPALNSRKAPMNEEQLKALGLQADATQEQIVARIAELDAAAKAPKADAVLTELKSGLATLAETVKGLVDAAKPAEKPALNAAETHALALNAVLDAAVQAGKIAPASRAGFAAMAADGAQLAKLQELINGMPVIAPNAEKPKARVKDEPSKHSADVRKIMAAFNLTEKDLAAE